MRQQKREKDAGQQNSIAIKVKEQRECSPPSDVIVQDHPFFSTATDTDTDTKSVLVVHKRKGPLETVFQNKSQEITDNKVGRFLYANGLSFNVVRSPFWKDMLRGANEAPKGYCGLGYEKVCITLLDDEVQWIENQLKPIRDSWVEIG